MLPSKSPEQRIALFHQFHQKVNTRPLFGACIGGWEGFSRYVKDTVSFLPQGPVGLENVVPGYFRGMYANYSASMEYPDDLMRSVEPVPSIPWVEAAAGLAVVYTGTNFWARGSGAVIGSLEVPPVENNHWIVRYGEFLDFLYEGYGNTLPVAQSILRGPLDVLAMAVGDENMIYAFYDNPEDVCRLLSGYTNLVKAFLRVQKQKTPAFMGGHVVGQYAIWAPGTVARLQQDAQSLLSARLYEEFVLPCDRELAAESEYNLYHIHSSAFHLLDVMLQARELDILQVSKDEGVSSIEGMMDGLQRIQRAGRCLVLKGRLKAQDIELVKTGLDYGGLCLQFVVDTVTEADEVMGFVCKKFVC